MIDQFTQGYVECALWSSSHSDEEGNDLGSFDEIDAEIAPAVMKEFEEDCADFQRDNADLLERAYNTSGTYMILYDASQAGHDFWLTRCGHGAGFWCRGLGEIGDKLTEAAHGYGGRDLYLDDDGMIYQG